VKPQLVLIALVKLQLVLIALVKPQLVLIALVKPQLVLIALLLAMPRNQTQRSKNMHCSHQTRKFKRAQMSTRSLKACMTHMTYTLYLPAQTCLRTSTHGCANAIIKAAPFATADCGYLLWCCSHDNS
jgi:hypothetical protein